MGIAGTTSRRRPARWCSLDDNFATIVVAVEIGRTIYDNILKFVRFQLSTNIGAILTILGAQLVGLPTPFTPIQMLWVNLIMDGPPAIGLGLDPPTPGVLARPPRRMSERILTRRRLVRLALLGAVMATGTLLVFRGARDGNLGGQVAGTMAFTTFVGFQLFNALNACSEQASVFRRHTLTNGRLWGALGAVAALQVAAVHLPVLGDIFDTVPLSATQWALCGAVAVTILVVDELRKIVTRSRERRVAVNTVSFERPMPPDLASGSARRVIVDDESRRRRSAPRPQSAAQFRVTRQRARGPWALVRGARDGENSCSRAPSSRRIVVAVRGKEG